MNLPALEVHLQQARQMASNGDRRALAAFQDIVEQAPDCLEAQLFLSGVAMSEGRPRDALAQMRAASAQMPDNPHLRKSLAEAAAACGEIDEAISALRSAVSLAPYRYDAFLLLGKLLELRGDRHGAVRAYFRAVTRAQMAEQWLDEASIPARLRNDVLRAMAVVEAGRTEVLASLMSPLLERFGRDAMVRVQACFDGFLGNRAIASPEPEQKPKFLYFPDIPSRRYLDPASLPGVDGLAAAYPEIRDEASRLLQDGGSFQPFLEFGSKDRPEDYLASQQGTPRWDAYFFYRHGEVFADHLATCPATAAALQAFPLCRIPGHAPEICFSLLAPDSHILPHHGVSNIRVVVHLPLVVPEGCALKVAGEEHAWQPGCCMVFDDTFEHEAWNRSNQPRLILLMDAWNPYLTEAERLAMTELIEGIGEFNRG